MRTRILLMFAGVALANCGLVDSDVADVNLDLPEKSFAVDAGSWMVDATSAAPFFATSCASMPTGCGAAVGSLCKSATCAGSCDPSTMRCVLGLGISVFKSIDLVTEKPELKTINDQPIIKVTIDKVTHSIRSNTLTVDVPELTVYVAPATVMKPSDPQAKAIGTIPAVAAGTVVQASEMKYTANGKADLVAAMSNYKVPFNIIVGATITVANANSIPMGKLEGGIKITAHAGL